MALQDGPPNLTLMVPLPADKVQTHPRTIPPEHLCCECIACKEDKGWRSTLGGVGVDGHELAKGGVLADDGVRLSGGDVNHVG